jgi:hypothetical protein
MGYGRNVAEMLEKWLEIGELPLQKIRASRAWNEPKKPLDIPTSSGEHVDFPHL